MRFPHNFIPKRVIFPCNIGGIPKEQGVVVKDRSGEGSELQGGTNSPIARDEKSVKSDLNKILSLPKIGPSEFLPR